MSTQPRSRYPTSDGRAAELQDARAVRAGNVKDVADEIWMTSVSVQGAHLVRDDLAATFGTGGART